MGKDGIEIYVLIPQDHQQPGFFISNGCSQNKCPFVKVRSGRKKILRLEDKQAHILAGERVYKNTDFPGRRDFSN